MKNISSPIVSVQDLKLIKSDKHVVIIDARSGTNAFARYTEAHFENALHVDLDHDLSQKPLDAAHGGRHPLPTPEDFGALLGRLGITPSTNVFVYDDKGGANAAARFWWMLKAAGHDDVYVINGGLSSIVKAGLAVSSASAEAQPSSPYPLKHWVRPTAILEEVATAAAHPDFVVVDVREAYRYRGESEPIDLAAGHIPGAVNIPYIDFLNPEGEFVSPEKLAAMFTSIIDGKEVKNVMVHCGSGVTACHALLAMEYAGLTGAQLYVGSWSEWSRNDRPVAKDLA